VTEHGRHLSRADVLRVARLARLSLSEAELSAIERDLERILVHMESLDALDTSGIEPMPHGFVAPTPLRADVPREPLGAEVALSNAPESEAGHFLVPRVVG